MKDRTIFALAIVTILAFTGSMVALALASQRHHCLATWANSGLLVRWSVSAKCQVRLANGRWVPTASVRAGDL